MNHGFKLNKRNYLFCASIITLLLIGPFPCMAQSGSSTIKDKHSYSFEELFKVFLKNNESIKNAETDYKVAEITNQGVFSTLYPQINLTLGYSQSLNDSLATNGTANSTGQLALTQNIFNGFSDSGKIKLNFDNFEKAKATYQNIINKQIYEFKIAFFNLLTAQENIDLSQEIFKRRESNAKLIKLRFEGGRENKGALKLAEAYLENAKLDVMTAKEEKNQYEMNLLNMLGEDFKKSNDHLSISIGKNVLIQWPISKNDIERKITSHPDYLMTIYNEKSAEVNLQSLESNFLPHLDLYLKRTTTGSGQDFFGNPQWSTGLSFSWNLFSGGKDYYERKSSLMNLASQKEKTHLQYVSLLEKAFEVKKNYELSIQQEKVAQMFVEANLLRTEIVKNKYNNGLSSFEEWDQIETALIQNQKNYLSSRKQKKSLEAQFIYSLGLSEVLIKE